MKRHTLVAALVTLIVPAAAARAEIHPGFAVGVNLATTSGDAFRDLAASGLELKRRTGLAAGGFMEFELGDNFRLRPEAFYMEKGVRITAPDDPDEVQIALAYLDLGLPAKIALATNGLRPYVLGGPSVSLRLRAKTKTIVSGRTVEDDIKDDVRKTDFNVLAGAGIELPLGRGHLGLEGRYTWGLRTVDSSEIDADDVKNRVLSFLATLTF